MDSPLVSFVYADLHTDEGLRLRVYDDATGEAIGPGTLVKGNPTIGIGRNLFAYGITHIEAETLLNNDIARIVNLCTQVFTWFNTLDIVRQRAVCNMVFQLGLAGFTGFTDTIIAIQQQDWLAVHHNLLASKWAVQCPARANKIADMMLTGSLIPPVANV